MATSSRRSYRSSAISVVSTNQGKLYCIGPRLGESCPLEIRPPHAVQRVFEITHAFPRQDSRLEIDLSSSD